MGGTQIRAIGLLRATELIDHPNTSQGVWADRAYRSAAIERMLRARGRTHIGLKNLAYNQSHEIVVWCS